MPPEHIQVTAREIGSRKLIKKFLALGAGKANRALRKSLRGSAKRIGAVARSAAPRDTGQVAKSFKQRAMRRSRVAIGMTVKTYERLADEDDRIHAVYSEYGTQTQQAQPYLRPAARKLKTRVVRSIRVAMLRAIREN